MNDGLFSLPTLAVARRLLGMHLVRTVPGATLRGRIVEVEAYHQDGDAASHTFSGKTARNAVMFGPPGFLYVYFIYGMHYCMNVVTEPVGIGAAVLIRALEPLQGIERMHAHRGARVAERNLTNGPAKACAALAVGPESNGVSLAGPALRLEPGEAPPDRLIASSPRIGISKSVDLPWRFFIKDNPHVSKSKWN